MDFQVSDEQRAFAETARAICPRRVAVAAPGWDERAEFPVEALRRAAEPRFAGIYVGDEFGGKPRKLFRGRRPLSECRIAGLFLGLQHGLTSGSLGGLRSG
jgi:alkylation response protein AidB-like acyl-CoA dehydrogenase